MIFMVNEEDLITKDSMTVETAASRYIQIKDYQLVWGMYQSDASGGDRTTYPSPFTGSATVVGSAPRNDGAYAARNSHRAGSETNTSCEIQSIVTSQNDKSSTNGNYAAIGAKTS